MSQVKVQWVDANDLYENDGSFVSRVPIIKLDSLTELVEGLRDRPKKERLESVEWDTAYLAALDDLKAQLEAHRKEGA